MAKDKMNIPQIRFKGFEGEWERDVLKKIAKINPTSNLPDKFKYIDLESVKGSSLIDYRIEYKNKAPSRAQRVAEKGDIFYQTVRPYQKNNYLFELFEKNYVFSTGYAQIRPLKNITSKFLFSLIQSEKFVNKVLVRCTGTSYPAINSTELSLIDVRYPLLKEQTQIGDFFQKIDQVIELQQKALDTACAYKQSMLQKMFPQKGEKVPRVRFAGFSGDWRDVALGDLVDKSIKWSFVGGPFGSNLKAEDYTVEGVRVIQLQNIGDGEFIDDHHIYVSPEKADDLLSCNIYPNDILIAKMGDPVARCCIVPEFHDRYLMCSDGIRVVVDSSKYHSLFIYQSINLSSFREKAISVGTGSTRKRINLSDLKKLELSAPCLEEQAQIGNFFQKLDQQIEQQAQKLATYQQLKKAMLQRMFV